MPRTSLEHEAVVDSLDRALVFAFALRSEMGREPGLLRLRELAKETREAVRKHPLGLLELGREPPGGFAVELVSRVMNGLEAATTANVVPDLPDLALEWINLPQTLSAADLECAHSDGYEDLMIVTNRILQHVNSEFPEESKPFISVAQFEAVSRGILARTPIASNVPLHVPSLVGLLHANFQASITAGRSPIVRHDEVEHLVDSYCATAEREHLAVVKQTFVIRTIQRLFPKAVDLSIPLDEHYNWTSLCALFPSARELLNLYASLIRSQVIDDRKLKDKVHKDTSERLTADFFIRFCTEITPGPRPRKGTQIYFDTDRSNIRIDGTAIQKYGVMAISYAAPLADIDATITRFGVFLLSARRAHCRATRGTFSIKEKDALQRLSSRADDLQQMQRVLLHDKSSVLAHLCALMALEMQLDHQSANWPSYKKVLTISEWLQEAGFKYSDESIRKSCDGLGRMLNNVQKYLEGR